MKNRKYYVWFFNKFETVYSSGWETAAIIATAKRIEAGLRYQITMIEEEKDDGSTEYVMGTCSVFVKETA